MRKASADADVVLAHVVVRHSLCILHRAEKCTVHTISGTCLTRMLSHYLCMSSSQAHMQYATRSVSVILTGSFVICYSRMHACIYMQITDISNQIMCGMLRHVIHLHRTQYGA